eukprot:TRINITY_DN22238_c0_g1_i2.p1 TRINITY_DN22238_c0_g1~~TRINITY_DN22238_c0_g1_i2.p1  ORF type:complete len:172 (-),score=68.72 TRINITY_DN22238_c0_g1_i2:102-617(-)
MPKKKGEKRGADLIRTLAEDNDKAEILNEEEDDEEEEEKLEATFNFGDQDESVKGDGEWDFSAAVPQRPELTQKKTGLDGLIEARVIKKKEEKTNKLKASQTNDDSPAKPIKAKATKTEASPKKTSKSPTKQSKLAPALAAGKKIEKKTTPKTAEKQVQKKVQKVQKKKKT